MGVMRHWIAHWDHGKIAVQAHVVLTAESADEHRANDWRVEGPFVLAVTNHQGAVEALRAIVAEPNPGGAVAADAMRMIAQTELRRIEGQ